VSNAVALSTQGEYQTQNGDSEISCPGSIQQLTQQLLKWNLRKIHRREKASPLHPPITQLSDPADGNSLHGDAAGLEVSTQSSHEKTPTNLSAAFEPDSDSDQDAVDWGDMSFSSTPLVSHLFRHYLDTIDRCKIREDTLSPPVKYKRKMPHRKYLKMQCELNRKHTGNPHWEIVRNRQPMIVCNGEDRMSMEEFLGLPSNPQACLMTNGHLAYTEGINRHGRRGRITDCKKFPVSN
jgi:hypothetical protein